MSTSTSPVHCARSAGCPLERVLFALAGTVTLLSALLPRSSRRGFCC